MMLLYTKVCCRFILVALAMIIPLKTANIIGPLSDHYIWSFYISLAGASYVPLLLFFGWEPLVAQKFKKNELNITSGFIVLFWIKVIISFSTLSYFAFYRPYHDQFFSKNTIVLGLVTLVIINIIFLYEAYKWVRIYHTKWKD